MKPQSHFWAILTMGGGGHRRPLRRGAASLLQTFAAGTPTASAVYDKLSVQIASTGHFHDSQLNCGFVLPTLADGQMERLIFAALVYKMNASLLVRVGHYYLLYR